MDSTPCPPHAYVQTMGRPLSRLAQRYFDSITPARVLFEDTYKRGHLVSKTLQGGSTTNV
ncbi:hypothetical protein AMTR_s00009p00047410 [Amborella trichopoda]|uniref:Uncharacterized protein n=1 Tax=Amborella trichopoda TaxID=13333 RepID=W1NHZ5_AMBTC|nr:hypothetical protein AMTR_s00009p00047410 [Amborella trichopoda]